MPWEFWPARERVARKSIGVYPKNHFDSVVVSCAWLSAYATVYLWWRDYGRDGLRVEIGESV